MLGVHWWTQNKIFIFLQYRRCGVVELVSTETSEMILGSRISVPVFGLTRMRFLEFVWFSFFLLTTKNIDK